MDQNSRRRKVTIIGAGLAGLSLASELVDEGYQVTVLEKYHQLGGRASNYIDEVEHLPVQNGPHIFVAAYNNLLRFFDKIGAKDKIEWEGKVFMEVYADGKHQTITNNVWPPPFYMIQFMMEYTLVSWRDQLSNVRLGKALMMASYDDLEKLDHMTAREYLVSKGVSPKSIDRIWGMLALSLLNISLDRASAAEFAILVKEWTMLWRRRLGFARGGLGDIYVNNAKKYIEDHGGEILHDVEVKEIVIEDGKVTHLSVDHNGIDEVITSDVYVSATTPIQLREMLSAEVRANQFDNHLEAFTPVPYITVHLWFDRKITDKQFWALLGDGVGDRPYINTDFYDLSNIFTPRLDKSYIASNIIDSDQYAHMTDQELIDRTVEELKEVFPDMQAQLLHARVNRLPYVVFAPIPGMRSHRLPPKTAIPNLFLSGDWTYKMITQCMEGAVRSGFKTAEAILAADGVEKVICDDRII